MADYFVPANIFQGRGAAESPGTGPAAGDLAIVNFTGAPGVDYMPNASELALGPVGGINHMSIGVLASDAEGDSDKEQPFAFLQAFQKIGANGGSFRITVPGGDDLVIQQCAYAGPGAAGVFYCTSSDVGLGPGQIPPAPQGWSKPLMAQHPLAFVRNASHCRGVASQLAGDQGAGQMNSVATSVAVFAVDSQPVWSSWCLLIDGQAQTVIFLHQDASGTPIDVRRPRDIWAQVVVPELQRRIAQAEPLPLYKDAGAGTVVQRGYISRLNYVSFARLGFYDPTVTLVRVGQAPPPPG